MNLVESLGRAADYLEDHSVGSARLNAEVLLGWVLGMSRVGIYANYQRPLSAEEAELYRIALSSRARGYPLHYITGRVGFLGVELEMRPGVFIPRPETETLAEKALEVLEEGPVRALDLGCGCGNLSVSLAVERGDLQVTAADIDWLAVELTRRNARRNKVADRVTTLEGDLFQPLDATQDASFDLVISNPPYVPSGSRDSLPVEVREFEPPGAVLGGPDGLDVIRRIAAEAPDYMAEGGWLLLEVDPRQAREVAGEILGGPEWGRKNVSEDLAGRPRVVAARLGRRR